MFGRRLPIRKGKRLWPWVFGGLFVFSKLYEWLVEPIVKLNIERWAEQHKIDSLLVQGDQYARSFVLAVVEILHSMVAFATKFLSSDLFLGFVFGSFVFAFWDPLGRYGKRLFPDLSILSRRSRINTAREWIRLADEINVEISQYHGIRPELFRSSRRAQTEDERHAEWEQQTRVMISDSHEFISRMRRRFKPRLAHAKLQMERMNIAKIPRMEMVNQFGYDDWAQKLSAEGRAILEEYGEPI